MSAHRFPVEPDPTPAPAATRARRVTAARDVGRTSEKCPYGETHDVTYYEVKYLTATGETRMHDNGYEQNQTPLFTDAQGRVYHQHVGIDFHNNISYVRDPGPGETNGVYFSGQVGRLARDLTGKPLTDRTPPGPSWAEALRIGTADGQPRRRRHIVLP